jgi:hypothetical protein
LGRSRWITHERNPRGLIDRERIFASAERIFEIMRDGADKLMRKVTDTRLRP